VVYGRHRDGFLHHGTVDQFLCRSIGYRFQKLAQLFAIGKPLLRFVQERPVGLVAQGFGDLADLSFFSLGNRTVRDRHCFHECHKGDPLFVTEIFDPHGHLQSGVSITLVCRLVNRMSY